jgi:hypothetical protein
MEQAASLAGHHDHAKQGILSTSEAKASGLSCTGGPLASHGSAPRDGGCQAFHRTVRHGYLWVPTDQAHCRPRQVGPAYQKTRRPVSGPNRPSLRPTRPPEDLLEDSLDDLFQTRRQLGVQDKAV